MSAREGLEFQDKHSRLVSQILQVSWTLPQLDIDQDYRAYIINVCADHEGGSDISVPYQLVSVGELRNCCPRLWLRLKRQRGDRPIPRILRERAFPVCRLPNGVDAALDNGQWTATIEAATPRADPCWRTRHPRLTSGSVACL